LLEYLEKPLLRLWPWLPLMAVAPLWGIARCLSSRPAGARQRADLGLLIGLFALNYAIAVIKPDPDVRYLYPSLPLIGVLCGGLLAQMTRATLPSWVLRTAPALLVLAVLYAALISVQGLPDRRGMATMRELVAAGTVTAANSAVVVEAIPPPDAPRRNNPMPDSIYYYLGLNPPRRFAPAATADLPAGTRYVFARRRPAYQQAFIALGFAEIARSAKIALYRVPEPAGAPGAPK
jgi:hypothetical protein